MYKCMKLCKNWVFEWGIFRGGFGLGLTLGMHWMKSYKSLSLSGVLLWWTWDIALCYETWRDDPDVLTFTPWEPGDD